MMLTSQQERCQFTKSGEGLTKHLAQYLAIFSKYFQPAATGSQNSVLVAGLTRCYGSSTAQWASYSTIAAEQNMSVQSVRRAWNYWEEQKVVKIIPRYLRDPNNYLDFRTQRIGEYRIQTSNIIQFQDIRKLVPENGRIPEKEQMIPPDIGDRGGLSPMSPELSTKSFKRQDKTVPAKEESVYNKSDNLEQSITSSTKAAGDGEKMEEQLPDPYTVETAHSCEESASPKAETTVHETTTSQETTVEQTPEIQAVPEHTQPSVQTETDSHAPDQAAEAAIDSLDAKTSEPDEELKPGPKKPANRRLGRKPKVHSDPSELEKLQQHMEEHLETPFRSFDITRLDVIVENYGFEDVWYVLDQAEHDLLDDTEERSAFNLVSNLRQTLNQWVNEYDRSETFFDDQTPSAAEEDDQAIGQKPEEGDKTQEVEHTEHHQEQEDVTSSVVHTEEETADHSASVKPKETNVSPTREPEPAVDSDPVLTYSALTHDIGQFHSGLLFQNILTATPNCLTAYLVNNINDVVTNIANETVIQAPEIDENPGQEGDPKRVSKKHHKTKHHRTSSQASPGEKPIPSRGKKPKTPPVDNLDPEPFDENLEILRKRFENYIRRPISRTDTMFVGKLLKRYGKDDVECAFIACGQQSDLQEIRSPVRYVAGILRNWEKEGQRMPDFYEHQERLIREGRTDALS